MIRLFVGLVALSSVLAASAAEWVKLDGAEVHPTRVLAKLKPAQNIARLGAVAPDAKVKRTYSEIPNLVVLEPKDVAKFKAAVAGDVDPAAALKKQIKDLQATGMFEYVEPDFVRHLDLTPTDRRFLDGTLWGLQNGGQFGGVAGADINVVTAWDLTTGDTNLVVAVIDTGVNYNHADLSAQMWRNPDEIAGNGVDDDNNGIIDDVFGLNAVTDTGDPLDDNGHGSHCAGTIGAAANNGFEHVGVIWNVQIMALKAGGGDGLLNSDIIQCINYTISKKVRLSNNSYGGTGFSQAQFDAMNAARSQGHLFLCSAGNDGVDNDRIPHYPSSFELDNIIAVAALDRRDLLADFSCFGLQSVDIGAPGVEIFSTWMGATNAYNTIDGTSMATPHVTGVAALSWSTDLTASYSDIRDRILQSATPIPSLAGKTTTGGRLNAFGAMGGNVDGILEISVTPPDGAYFGVGGQRPIYVKVRDVFNVNDATVVGRFNNVNYTFVNNGTGADTNANDGIYTATLTMPLTPGNYTLSIDIAAPGKTPAHENVTYQVLTPPQNDIFARAIKIPAAGAIREGDNRLATPEPGALPGDPAYGPDIGEPLHAGVSNVRSLWWSYSSPSVTPVIIDTAGTSFDDDAVLGVYTGSTVSTLSEVGSARATVNGPNGTRAPFVKFTTQPNLTYWIAVAQSELGTNSPGKVILRVEPNGELDTTPPIVRVTNILSGTFIRSTTNTITLSGTSEDPLPNASGVASVQIKTVNDLLFQTVNGTTNWVSPPIQLANGVNKIQLTAFDRADNQAAITEFTVTYIPQELSNDLIGYSTTLVGNSGVTTSVNTNSTKEFQEPAHGGNEGGHSVWWNYRPTQDGILFISTEGSTFDTLLGLYTVADETVDRSVQSLILVDDNDDANPSVSFSEINATVQGGRLYYIAVDGYGQQAGNIHLQYDFTPVTVYPVTTVALPGGTISPAGTTVYPIGSAVTVTTTPDRYKQLQQFFVTITNVQSGEVRSFSTNAPMFTFEVTGGVSITAEFTSKVFADDFESGGFGKLPWEVPGNNWRVQQVTTNTETGGSTRVARTVELGNSQTASLILVTNLASGLGSFEIRTSTETNYDRVEFFLDGRLLKTWSGEVPWSLYTFEIPAKEGTTRLEWRYTKDFAASGGEDAVFIDNVDLPFPLPPPIVLGINASTMQITVSGPRNADVQLQTSTDFVNWFNAGEATINPSGTATFNIPPFTDGQRFYKVVQL